MMGLVILLMITNAAISAHALEMRSCVATDSYTWNSQNFAGFAYDIDRDFGSDTLTTTLTEGNWLSGDYPYGIVYETRTGTKMFLNAQADMKYGKLRVSTIDSTTDTITLDNKDNAIVLSRNKNTEILPGIFIRTADNDSLRYYIYENVSEPGTYEMRGAVAGTINGQSNLADSSFTWNPQNYAGFYYDISKDLGTETIRFDLSGDDGKTLSGDVPYGVTYITTTQIKAFERALWGSYKVIGFLAESCFAGYNEGEDAASNIFYKESTDKNSLSSEQLERILMDEKSNMVVKKGESIKLKEGYELILKGVNSDGQIYLELFKDGSIVDSKVASPSRDGATDMDKTYYYRMALVGKQKNLVTIAVHFKNTYKDEELAVATVDGIWQISDKPIDVSAGTQYGKMNLRSIDANSGTIIMDNKDNQIVLAKKTDVDLMPGIKLRTANNDTLRFYIYRIETVGAKSI
jgi:S-layer protein (TIGR01567 family)